MKSRSERMRLTVRADLLCMTLLCALLTMTGCNGPSGGGPGDKIGETRRPSNISYQRIANTHNERVQRLDKVWSRMGFAVRRPDPDDPTRTLTDQAEGHIQFEQPWRVSVSMTKLGELYFLLGSNEIRYWWIDRSNPKEPVVLFGLHELAGPSSLEWLGVGVAPLDLVDLFGITPLPYGEEELDVWVRTEPDGRLAVIVPSRFGYRKMYFDAKSMDVSAVELLDMRGDVLVVSELSRPRRVPVVGEGLPGEFMATRVRIDLPRENASITIELAEQENRTLNEGAFDLPRLIRAYARNGVLYDLDAQPEGDVQPEGDAPEEASSEAGVEGAGGEPVRDESGGMQDESSSTQRRDTTGTPN